MVKNFFHCFFPAAFCSFCPPLPHVAPLLFNIVAAAVVVVAVVVVHFVVVVMAVVSFLALVFY